MTALRRGLIAAALIAGTLFGAAAPAFADPSPPTNGGSNNGGGQSGQCAGKNADRPAACGN